MDNYGQLPGWLKKGELQKSSIRKPLIKIKDNSLIEFRGYDLLGNIFYPRFECNDIGFLYERKPKRIKKICLIKIPRFLRAAKTKLKRNRAEYQKEYHKEYYKRNRQLLIERASKWYYERTQAPTKGYKNTPRRRPDLNNSVPLNRNIFKPQSKYSL